MSRLVRRSSYFCYSTTFIVQRSPGGVHLEDPGDSHNLDVRTGRRCDRDALHLRPAARVMTAVADRAVDRARWFALIVLCTGMLMIILDSAIVNVALPWIQRDLGFSQSELVWVVNGYLITFGGLLLLAGRVGDLIGRRRIFLAGMALFTFASLLCGIAQSQGTLVASRFLQGTGGALTSSVILG